MAGGELAQVRVDGYIDVQPCCAMAELVHSACDCTVLCRHSEYLKWAMPFINCASFPWCRGLKTCFFT